MQPGETFAEWLISQLCSVGNFASPHFLIDQRQCSGEAIALNKTLVGTPTSGWSACASRRYPYDGRNRLVKLCLNKDPFRRTLQLVFDAQHCPMFHWFIPCGARRLRLNGDTEGTTPTLSSLLPSPDFNTDAQSLVGTTAHQVEAHKCTWMSECSPHAICQIHHMISCRQMKSAEISTVRSTSCHANVLFDDPRKCVGRDRYTLYVS